MHELSSSARFTTAALLALLLVVLTPNDFAIAKLNSSASKQFSATTTRWGTVTTSVGGVAQSIPYTLTWSNNTGTQYAYIDLVNVGSLATTGNSILVSTIDSKNSTSSAPRLTFTTCSGSWNQTTNSCSGSTTNLGNVTNGTLSITLALAISTRRTLRISANKTKAALWTSTLSISVSRSQVRTATTTNS